MNKFIISLLFLSLSLWAMSAKPKIYQDYHILAVNTDKENVSALDIKKALTTHGFTVSALTSVTSKHYKSYHILNFVDEEISSKIMEKLPQAALFHPMGMAIYQKKNDPYLWMAFLSSRTHSKVLNLRGGMNAFGLYDRKVIAALLTTIKQARFKQHNSSQKRIVKKLDIYKQTSSVDGKEVLSKLQKKLKAKDFIVEEVRDIPASKQYDYFKQIIFHEAKTLQTLIEHNPEAGAFFPSTIIVYKNKHSSQASMMHIDTGNIIDSSNVQSTPSLRALVRRQALIDKILKP